MYNVLKIATEYQYCSTTVAVRAHCDNRNSPDVMLFTKNNIFKTNNF